MDNSDNVTFLVGVGLELGVGIGGQAELGLVRFPGGQWETFISFGGGFVAAANVEGFGGADGNLVYDGDMPVSELIALPGMTPEEFFGWSIEAGGSIPLIGPVGLGGEVEVPLNFDAIKSFDGLFLSRSHPDGSGTQTFSVAGSVGVGGGLTVTLNHTSTLEDASDFVNSVVIDRFGDIIRELREKAIEAIGEDPADQNKHIKDLVEAVDEFCFAAGTNISMANGAYKSIETVKIGDWVMAHDPLEDGSRGELKPQQVTQVQTREVEETLDFHGTIVTPGHVFLSGDGTFKKLADILEEDGTVVREDGTVVRARTNYPVGSEEDRVVPLRYTDPETGEAVTASIRAGAPFAADGDKVVTVAEGMRKIGYELGADGLFVDLDGNKVPAQWPWGKPEPMNLAENRVSFV